MSLLKGFFSLNDDTNKAVSNPLANDEGVVSDLLPELTLEMEDSELIALSHDWQKTWEPYAKEITKKQTENENYWLGKQFNNGEGPRPIVDNLIFESLETFLPIATRPKADPLVESNGTELGNAIADKVRKMLIYIADTLSLNLKMKQVARYWAIYLLGPMKVGWSMQMNDITCIPVRPQKLILDPTATIEACEYRGYYIGEYVEDMASDLMLRFPKKKEYITGLVDKKTGTKIQYIMWTTDDYVFWTLDNEVLGKNKNPHWNYDTKQNAPMNEFGSVPMDPSGQPQQTTIPGRNHFTRRMKPYVFLSVFNLGMQPHDNANLIQQNLPLQDLINKRLMQIDKNADNANNGIAVSGDAFTKEQAQQVASAKRKGGAIWVPTGPIDAAVKVLPTEHLPNFIYESLIDYRNELRNIFGTRGSTPQGTMNEQTLGGKKIVKGQDGDRIGGGVSVYLEQFSDALFNWFVQLMYVYYDEPHFASVLGSERAQEYIQLVNTDFTTKLLVGVKEGSMIPHDPANERLEAIELWGAQGIDPITFFDRLEFPNPREAAKNLFLWKANPIALFPDLMAQQQQQQEQMMAQQQQQLQGQQQQQQQVEAQKSDKSNQHELKKIQLQGLVKSIGK